MRPVQPSVVAVQRHVMLSAVPSSGTVNSVIRITGIGDRDRPEWLIRITGMRLMHLGLFQPHPVAFQGAKHLLNIPYKTPLIS